MPVAAWDALNRPANALLPGGKGIAQAGDKAHKLARALDDSILRESVASENRRRLERMLSFDESVRLLLSRFGV